MNGAPLVLASASATRGRMLRAAGVAFETSPARIDEDEIKRAMIADGADGAAIAEALAELKARQVARGRAGTLVIGADQVLEMDGVIFSKPESLADARRQLARLRGRAHALVSCACVVRDGVRLWHALDRARLVMRDFSDEFLDSYLSAIGAEALDGPGAYRLEGRGAQLFAAVRGDYFTILGLPLLPLLGFLREHRALAT